MNAPLAAPPTRAQIERRRRLAEALQREGTSTAPVGHWTGALARALQGGVAGWQANKADEMEQGRGKALADALSRGGDPSALEQAGISMDAPELLDIAGGRRADARDQRNFGYQQARDAVEDSQWAQGHDLARTKLAQTGSGDEYGLNPVWAKGPDGKWGLFQPSKAGGQPGQMQFPEGYQPQPNVQYHDTGTGFVGTESKGGAVAGQPIQKDVAGAAQQKALGENLGTSQANLPKAESTAQGMLDMITSISDDPNKGWGTGASALGNVIPATPGYDFQQKVNQLQGQAFLQAFESLKGGGQITQIEGEKATQAIGRLQTAQSEDAFNSALTDLEVIVRRGLDRARKQAGAASQGGGNIPTYNPQTGEFE